MTIMRVTLAGTRLEAHEKAKAARRLIDAFAEVEVGNTSPAIRAGFVVHFDEVDPEDLYMGDQPMVAASETGRAAIVDTRVMAGPWNDAMKTELFEKIETIVRDVAGMPRRGAGAEFGRPTVAGPAGAGGWGGRAVSIEALSPVFEEDRQARIRSHLARRNDTSS